MDFSFWKCLYGGLEIPNDSMGHSIETKNEKVTILDNQASDNLGGIFLCDALKTR